MAAPGRAQGAFPRWLFSNQPTSSGVSHSGSMTPYHLSSIAGGRADDEPLASKARGRRYWRRHRVSVLAASLMSPKWLISRQTLPGADSIWRGTFDSDNDSRRALPPLPHSARPLDCLRVLRTVLSTREQPRG